MEMLWWVLCYVTSSYFSATLEVMIRGTLNSANSLWSREEEGSGRSEWVGGGSGVNGKGPGNGNGRSLNVVF